MANPHQCIIFLALSLPDENINIQIKINQGHLMSAVFLLYCAGTVHSCTEKTGLRIRIWSDPDFSLNPDPTLQPVLASHPVLIN